MSGVEVISMFSLVVSVVVANFSLAKGNKKEPTSKSLHQVARICINLHSILRTQCTAQQPHVITRFDMAIAHGCQCLASSLINTKVESLWPHACSGRTTCKYMRPRVLAPQQNPSKTTIVSPFARLVSPAVQKQRPVRIWRAQTSRSDDNVAFREPEVRNHDGSF